MSKTADASVPRADFSQRCGAWGYQAFCALLRVIDIRMVAVAGRAVGYLVWAAIPSRRRIVARNLRIVVDPMLRADKLRPMVRRNIVRTVMNLACSLKTGLMTEREAARAIRMEGADVFEAHGMNGHTVISCIPHAGNWEVLARIRPYFTRVEHFGSMYRRLSNPILEDLVYKSRTRYGCEMFSKEDGLRAVLRLARTGGLLGVLSDQFTNEGIYVPYFGKVTGVTPLPALLYQRCKGKGHLFSVFTRNTGLGRWDAVLGRQIELPDGCNSLPAITLEINRALEKSQSENILDGFWMHHRWKATAHFAPPQDADTEQIARSAMRLPFRIIIAMPESFEEALFLLPALRVLKRSRFDAQLTVVCPGAQRAYWQRQPEVCYTVSTDDTARSAYEQLQADELYKDGPFDVLFMFSENKKLFRQLKKLMPIYTSGFQENPLCGKRHFRARISRLNCGHPRPIAQDYLELLRREHGLNTDNIPGDTHGNESAHGAWIAPFSTLGEADAWPEERWAELVQHLEEPPTLLALPQDEERARALAQRLHVELQLSRPEEVAQHLGSGCRLYAVDGLLPELAAAAGCRCHVIMASRESARYAPLGEGHRICVNHTPCHPCYQQKCDQASPCTAGVSAEALLGEEG